MNEHGQVYFDTEVPEEDVLRLRRALEEETPDRLPRTVPQDPQAVEDERAVREKVRLRTEALREGRRLSIEEGLIPPD
jgi:hypothetical protein